MITGIGIVITWIGQRDQPRLIPRELGRDWNGIAWSSVDSGTPSYLLSVRGAGPNNVWAVGDDGALQHWNGIVWSSLTSGTQNSLGSIWIAGPTDVWMLGTYGTILRGP